MTLTVSAVSPATSLDFELSANRELRNAAGRTASTGAVTVTAVDNLEDHADREFRVLAAVTGAGVTAPPARTLTITAGETSRTGEFTLTPVHDDQPENDERIDVRGHWGVGTRVHRTAVRLTDSDDPRPMVTLSVEPDAIVEGQNGDVFMTAELLRSEETAVTLLLGGTATDDAYLYDPSGTLTIAIPANATTTEKTADVVGGHWRTMSRKSPRRSC